MSKTLPAVKDLGWANSWKETPEIVKKCEELKHEIKRTSGNMRGTDNTVRCDICRYVYKYDSSG